MRDRQKSLSTSSARRFRVEDGFRTVQTVQFARYETHPPLGNVLRYWWIKISDDPAFIRAQSLLFGLALILIFYRTGAFLNGPLTGMCCAALTAFSYGCVIQSFVIRHYIFFVVFISAAHFYYLRWREERKSSLLWTYAAFCLLGCLTHFTGIL